MLKLKDITKVYQVADTKVDALRGINLCFRKNEFVSILGPSGCGKTTLLNIIGGLDKYTDGDLSINGRSTKEYKDRDWDVYRNHRIGFIFQSYNLIPHQTILGNVELALTISGLSKAERQEKAKKALDRVGLSNQYNKRPNQLSGGQCQRVAIARALVNEPEILLADEPTGALDTVTSIQIMDLIQEIAQERLVIMVTHNPELAYKYSTRIVKLLDGSITEDSNPYSEEEEMKESYAEEEQIKVKEKAKMSFWTAFKLSAKNLFSKRGRTIMTCFAGSIGIIGISMVLAVSAGVKGYIKDMQDDMLSGNPITIEEETLDFSSMMSMLTPSQKAEVIKKAQTVNVDFLMEQLLDQYNTLQKVTISNDITQEYVDYVSRIPSEYAACISLDYGLDMTNNIYTDFPQTSDLTKNTSLSAIRENYIAVLKHIEGLGEYSAYITNIVNCFAQAPNNEEYIKSQYNILNGRVATKADEIMVVLDKDSQLTDLVLAELGYFVQDDFIELAKDIKENPDSEHRDFKKEFSYDEIMGKEFTWYKNDSIFYKPVLSNPFVKYNYHAFENDIEDRTDALKLKIVGILEPKEDINYGCLTSGFYYTEALTKYALDKNKDSEIVKELKNTSSDEAGLGTSSGISSGKYKYGDFLVDTGITYDFEYKFDGKIYSETGFVGTENMMMSLLNGMGISIGQMEGSVYTLTLRQLGGEMVANSIRIYPVNFVLKDKVTDYLDAWNGENSIFIDGNEILAPREKVTYTDNVGLIINMVNTLINVVTYALVAFTALSLVVSCVMIGIITYVSVVERIKEIGVIRSLGGRKRDVSHLFNAETFIIGLIAGVIGICVTYILSAIANLIIGHLVGIYTIASLPFYQALIMIAVSIILTCISGLIPARSAAKKDPVVALRTE